MQSPPLPPVLRSREALRAEGLDLLPPRAVAPTALPIMSDGTTFSMAQDADWIDADHFAVGRWDGSLSIFAWTDANLRGPLITTAVSDPFSEGVQMVQVIGDGRFVTSAGEGALALWTSGADGWDTITPTLLDYPVELGAANSAALLAFPSESWLAVGHAGGFLTTWRWSDAELPQLTGKVDLRSADPLNPYGIHNIRGVAMIGPSGPVVAGSEDALVSVVELKSGRILSQTVYNPAAKRGINSIALNGRDLLVANCSVGSDDSNLWYFTFDAQWTPQLAGKADLKVDPAAPQAFNFCTMFALGWGDGTFLSSTEEGALWMGTASDGTLAVRGYQEVTSPLGSALAWQAPRQLALVSYDVYEFVADV